MLDRLGEGCPLIGGPTTTVLPTFRGFVIGVNISERDELDTLFGGAQFYSVTNYGWVYVGAASITGFRSMQQVAEYVTRTWK